MDAPPIDTKPIMSVRLIMGAAFGLAVVAAGTLLALTLNRPLIDDHGFRQTQTAISVYWMLHGGPWLDYWTPVMGAPWQVPFEFPLYQWIVAGLVTLTGLPIDAAGRLVSFAWLLLAIPPANYLLREHGLPRSARLVFPALLLASPVYLFWGRAFLIETQALTLCVAQLAFFHRWLVSRRAATLALAVLFGIGGTLTKITTLVPFLMLSGLMLIAEVIRARRREHLITPLLGWLLVYTLPTGLTSVWNHHADAVKERSPIATWLSLDRPGLIAWNFGTLDQRFSLKLVRTIIASIGDTLSLLGVIAVIGIVAHLVIKRREWRQPSYIPIAACLAAYLLPYEVFTNLHIQHVYYRASNSLFLIAAVTLLLGCYIERWPGLIATIVLVLVLSQIVIFVGLHGKAMRVGYDIQDYRLGMQLRALTPPGSAIIVYGRDWNPIIPYYAQRRAVMESTIPAIADVRRRAAAPATLLDGQPIGAIVYCPSSLDSDRPLAAALTRTIAPMRRLSAEDCMVYLPRHRS